MEPERPDDSEGGPAPDRRASNAHFLAMAFELPFTMVGPVFVAALVGYFVDRYFGTSPLLLVLGCGAGFYAGLREVQRRMKQMDKNANGKRSQ